MNSIRYVFASLVMTLAVAHAGPNWPHWRGPTGNGIGEAKNLATTWSLEQNIVWKTALPSWSGASPVIWGDRIFLMSASAKPAATIGTAKAQFLPAGFGGGGYGRKTDPGGQELLLLCLAKKDGKLLWQRKLDEGNRVWNKQNNASPSPVTDGKIVWTVTGNGVVTALDMEGNPLWKRNLQTDYGRIALNWGYASSPLLHEGKLIIEVLHGYNPQLPSYLVALDGASGKVRWRADRPTDALRESPDAYTTPALLTHNGKKQIVISGGDYVTGHDPDTGKEIWRASGLNPGKSPVNRIVPSPVAVDGMVYAPSRKVPLLALKAGGTGDVTTSHLAWKWEAQGGPDVPTPACDGKYFYMVDERGMTTCLNAKTGKVIWGPERTAQGTVNASPLVADGKIYILNESAVTTVLAAGPEFKVLATNQLDGSYTLSSMAVAGEQLFVRTDGFLYCIGKK